MRINLLSMGVVHPLLGIYLAIYGTISSNSGDDTRITALETKTQNILSTSSKLSLSKSFELKLDTSDFFAIRSIDSMLNYLIFNPTITMLYPDLNMNAKNVNNLIKIAFIIQRETKLRI